MTQETDEASRRLTDSHAVVAYLRCEAAGFIDALRCELTPGCPHHSHVTVLRPRPLDADTAELAERCRQILSRFDSFEIELGDVSVFESTRVIKVSLKSGISELRTLHDILNAGPLAQEDDFPFVPHVTLCQEAPPERFDEFLEAARVRWAAYQGSRRVRVESLTLVCQREDGTWADLAELPLGQPQPVRAF